MADGKMTHYFHGD